MMELGIKNLKFEKAAMSVADFVRSVPDIMKYPFLTVTGMSSKKVLGDTESILRTYENWSEVTEFRCFGEEGEVHGMLSMDKIVLSSLCEVGEVEDTSYIDFTNPLSIIAENNKYKSLTARRYVTYDEDGQATFVVSRLKKLI